MNNDRGCQADKKSWIGVKSRPADRENFAGLTRLNRKLIGRIVVPKIGAVLISGVAPGFSPARATLKGGASPNGGTPKCWISAWPRPPRRALHPVRVQAGSYHGQFSPDRGFCWRWSGYSKLTLDRATVAACSIPIDALPLEHRAGEKPTVRKTLSVATRYARAPCRKGHSRCSTYRLPRETFYH